MGNATELKSQEMAKTQKTKGRANSVDEHIGGRLRQRRTLLGFSQEKLAEALGITFQQIQKYENGANRISASRLDEISKILSVPFSFFFENAPDISNTGPPLAGFAEGEQDPFDGEKDIMQKKETLELIRVYYSIKDPKLRKDLFKLLKSMTESIRNQDFK